MVTAVICVIAGWSLVGGFNAGFAHPSPVVNRSGERSGLDLQGRGTGALSAWAGRIEAAGDADLEPLATELLRDPRRGDRGLWAPLLARWSAVDGAGMIAFLERQAPPALRQELLGDAWFAWGASDPEAAFAAGSKQPPALVESLLQGIAEVDVRKAAEWVKQVADSHWAVQAIADRVAAEAPELAADLLTGAMYDCARVPFERAEISRLAATDPAGAIAYARRSGVLGFDPVPGAVREIARRDPQQAAEQVASMPSSRSKALSAVALAETWAAQDLPAAAAWIRSSLSGPTRQYALVAAAASGGGDPAASLDLIPAADWVSGGDFFSIRDSGIRSPSEYGTAPNPRNVAISLLQQWSRSDPVAARDYLKEHIPGGLNGDIGKATGITP